MERLLLVLEAAAKADPQGVAARLTAPLCPDVYLVNRGDKAECVALALARDLRAAGLWVELDSSGSAFGKQFKRADRSGARWAMVLGDEEAARAEVRLKPLQQQAEECTVALAPVAAIVEKLLTP
jgi:histidyl-tRNA synthetase